MLSFLEKQLRQYHNRKKSHFTSNTHWALLFVFIKNHMWDVQQEKVSIKKKKESWAWSWNCVPTKHSSWVFWNVWTNSSWTARTVMHFCLFSFSLLSSFYHLPWRGVPKNLQGPGRVLHIMHVREESCRLSEQMWDMKPRPKCWASVDTSKVSAVAACAAQPNL